MGTLSRKPLRPLHGVSRDDLLLTFGGASALSLMALVVLLTLPYRPF